jgi:DNA polymerase III subunit delta'
VPFRDIQGHRLVLELLSSAVERGAVPQSLLFTGPDGVGKRLTALALAQAINCTERPRPCGKCNSCRKIARGVHPDVLVIEPGDTGSIKVEEIRDAIGRSAYRPFEGHRRVTIIDEADALVPNAQDALLKTLEEPPSGSIFVLVTARPDALLPTIPSRCYRLRFGRLAEAEVAEILREHHGWSVSDALAAAALADGSVGAALEVRTEEAADARESAVELLRGVASARTTPNNRLEHGRALAGGAERDELVRRLRAAASMLRDMRVLAAGASPRFLANADLRDELAGLAGSYNADRGLDAFSAVDAALEALGRNVGPKVVADWIAMEL